MDKMMLEIQISETLPKLLMLWNSLNLKISKSSLKTMEWHFIRLMREKKSL